MRASVIKDTIAYGVDSPGACMVRKKVNYGPQTYDWRAGVDSPLNSAKIEPHAATCPDLVAAITEEYDYDAYLLMYQVDGADRHPRFNHGAIPWIESEGIPLQVYFLCIDGDTPKKVPVTPEWYHDQLARIRRVYPRCGVFATRHGFRIVQPLVAPIHPDVAEGCLARVMRDLESVGVVPDKQCSDWTRFSGLANTRRRSLGEREVWHSPSIDLEAMEPVEVEPMFIGRARSKGAARPPINFTNKIPDRWVDLIVPAARAISSGSYKQDRKLHDLFLCLSGALLNVHCPADIVPALVAMVAREAGADPSHHIQSAYATVRKWGNRDRFRGLRRLQVEFPAVVEAASQLFGSADQLREEEIAAERSVARAEVPVLPAAEVSRRMREIVRKAPMHVSLLAAQPGQGKTEAFIAVAVERAQSGARSKSSQQTGITVPTNELAVEVTNRLRAMGIPVCRVFSPVSLLDPVSRRPVCRFATHAKLLARGHLSIPWELCDGRKKNPCPHRSGCAAVGGMDEDPGALVTVGTHASLSRVADSIGAHGLLCIDEPPWELVSQRITLHDLEVTERLLGRFVKNYARAMRPALRAALAFLAEAEVDHDYELAKSLALPIDPLVEADAIAAVGGQAGPVAYAQAAVSSDHARHRGPPLKLGVVPMAASGVLMEDGSALADLVGTACRVLGSLHSALTENPGAKVYVSMSRTEDNTTRALTILTPNKQLIDALLSERPVILADASIHLHAAILKKILDYAPPLHEFASPDGAVISRLHVQTRATTNRALTLADGKPDPRAICHALKIAADLHVAGRRTLVVAYKWLEAYLLTAEDSSIIGELARFEPPVNFAHFGAIRGIDAYKSHDVCVTLGDPRPNIGVTQREAYYLAEGETPEERNAAVARAELQQAHGRLRPIHRTKPAWMVHIGDLRPDGWSNEVTEVKSVRGRSGPSLEPEMTQGELHDRIALFGGSARAFAAAAFIPWGTFANYLGERAASIPPHHASKVRGVKPMVPGLWSAPPIGLEDLRELVRRLGGVPKSARVAGVARSTMERYVSGESRLPSEIVRLLQQADWRSQIDWRGNMDPHGVVAMAQSYIDQVGPWQPVGEGQECPTPGRDGTDPSAGPPEPPPPANDTARPTDPDHDPDDTTDHGDHLDTSFDPSSWTVTENPAPPPLALLSLVRVRVAHRPVATHESVRRAA